MAEVAKILGLELGEEFKISGFGTTHYKLTECGLYFFNVNGEWEKRENYVLMSLLTGMRDVVKLPWKPKRGDTYCYVYWKLNLHTKKWEIDVSIATYDDNCPPHNLCVDVGNCFKIREEAEAQKYEVYKRLTGKDWSEVHG